VSAGDSIRTEVWASFDLPQRPGWPVTPVVGGADAVPEGVAGKARAEWQRLHTALYASQSGYLEVKLVDESPTPVFFDDLLLKIIKARGMQENHYDPWGLNLVGIESLPVDRLERKQYNGKEKVSDYGLEWNFHDARTLDKQTGRWCQVDPLAEEEGQDAYSPYHFSYDNPVRYSDPDGNTPGDPNPYVAPNPLYYVQAAGLGMLQSIGAVVDRIYAFVNATTTDTSLDQDAKVGKVEVLRTASTEEKYEAKVQTNLKEAFTPNASNKAIGPYYRAEVTRVNTAVVKYEVRGNYRGLDVKTASVVKMSSNGTISVGQEASVGLGTGKVGSASAGVSVEANNKGQRVAKGNVKLEAPAIQSKKTSISFGLGIQL
jgi:RHS repeat-associated protein